MNIVGNWNTVNNNPAVITQDGKNVSVTINGPKTRTAKGVLLSSNPGTSSNPVVVNVNFTDDARYIVVMINNHQIQWCRIGSLRTDNVWNKA